MPIGSFELVTLVISTMYQRSGSIPVMLSVNGGIQLRCIANLPADVASKLLTEAGGPVQCCLMRHALNKQNFEFMNLMSN